MSGSHSRDGNPDLRNSFAQQTVKDLSPLTSHFSRKRTAFTLAEVLITLGIIGVVAALTMPTLIANYQKQKTVTQLKKVYSTLNQAFKLSENFNGEFESWDKKDDVGAVAVYEKYWQPYLNGAKVCIGYEECGYKETWPWQTLGGERKTSIAVSSHLDERINFILSDGTFVSLSNQIYVDLNGPQKPNIYGKDFFVFTYNKRGVVPDMYGKDKDWIIHRCSKDNNYDAATCSARLIMVDNWEMAPDYPW